MRVRFALILRVSRRFRELVSQPGDSSPVLSFLNLLLSVSLFSRSVLCFLAVLLHIPPFYIAAFDPK